MNFQESNCAPRPKQWQHLSAARQKTPLTTGRAKCSFCSKEDKHGSKENARNLQFRVEAENSGVCSLVKETFCSLRFLPVQDPLPLAAKFSLSALLQPNPTKANNKRGIDVQRDIWLRGGDRRAIQHWRGDGLTAAQASTAHPPRGTPPPAPAGAADPRVFTRAAIRRNSAKYPYKRRLPHPPRRLNSVEQLSPAPHMLLIKIAKLSQRCLENKG